ncbi:glycosyltransferase family 4 protein [Mucilaginibacter sp. RS28]|uniref:Glycosyltransferase family 4 protein n=1 Tax=Mucilaginibacter straminoryzae TaxID=2932774 RepID=A0A9X1X437_9SPHI|nr:glycosyltransferase family 4 protein [Mucilaginibacter straminoryzae]MCJ8209800.1 glycosyltransferase family 4 protein [Mucilaginibacter straminoryzae]
MKVAFVTRLNLYKIAGGDTVQIEQTARQLRNLGVEVDILRSVDPIPYEQYDILHFFGIPRPGDMVYHSSKAKMPFVVSTIHCTYGNYYKYNKKGIGAFFSFLNSDSMEYFKTIARWIVGKDHCPSRHYFLNGQRKSIVHVLETADFILPNSYSELNRLKELYTQKVKGWVVTNGINPEKFPYDPTIQKDDNLVICVGRIENRKNQLNLIKALNNTAYKLVLIGEPSANQLDYYNECKSIAGPNVVFAGRLSHEDMVHYYQVAKVHVLASWFETTGLSSLEAALMHCNIVITEEGDTREYFGEDAFYCTPENPDSIRQAVDKAIAATFNPELAEKIKAEYTWRKAAEQTLAAYQALVPHRAVVI